MIQERYCSHKISKLLQEKGFDEPCRSVYVDCGYYIDFYYSVEEQTDLQMGVWEVLRPTHQTAIDWLREKHGIFIEIFSSIDLNGNYHYSYNVLGSDCKYIRKGYTSFDWGYKDVVEAALEFCLTELI